uniref:Uncharacterized protein n=1 Tax=Neisseria meningitidis alpha275 TaxID=295996 RepID=C6SGV3_NEIME|nr:hypothetical protein predicted by Glimmer/Critica [Neisseria meningitidis alpha275]
MHHFVDFRSMAVGSIDDFCRPPHPHSDISL